MLSTQPRPDLFLPWQPADATAWGFNASPVGRPTGRTPILLPLDTLPRSDREVKGGEIAPLCVEFEHNRQRMEELRPYWEPMEAQLDERAALLNEHLRRRWGRRPGVPGVVTAQLSEEVRELRAALADLKRPWNDLGSRSSYLVVALRSKFGTYENRLAWCQWRAAHGMGPEEDDLCTIHRLIGENELTTQFLRDRSRLYRGDHN